MDDHFWPSIYPGVAVGVLVGLAYSGTRNIMAGAIGGLLGAIACYFVTSALHVDEGLVSLLAFVVAAAAGAWALISVVRIAVGPRGADGA